MLVVREDDDYRVVLMVADPDEFWVEETKGKWSAWGAVEGPFYKKGQAIAKMQELQRKDAEQYGDDNFGGVERFRRGQRFEE